MSRHTRRNVLTAIGTAAAGSLAGCATLSASDRPHVMLSMSERLKDQTTETERSQILEVSEQYIVQALELRRDESVSMEFSGDFYDILSTDIDPMLDEFQSQVSEKRSQLSHICLCGDIGGQNASGSAEIMDSNCSPNAENTNLGIVTGTHTIHTRSDMEPKRALRINDVEPFDHRPANRALATLIHEVGHNLCLTHGEGHAWYGVNAPDVYDPIQDQENIYISPMLGFYYYSHGGLPSTADEDTNIPTYNASETVYMGTVYRPSI